MGLFSFSKTESPLKWIKLESNAQLDEFTKESFKKPVLLFKHSTRCSISIMAKTRLDQKWDIEDDAITPVYLDLLKHRDISNKIAEDFNIIHQSPQVLLIKEGKCVYTSTHSSIDPRMIKKEL